MTPFWRIYHLFGPRENRIATSIVDWALSDLRYSLGNMMNRRQFLCAATASATLGGTSNLFAAKLKKYDLIVKGGRVIDPSRKIDGVRDVAIAGGRIAAIEANVSADASEMIDAHGKLVLPGLIDIHTHAARVSNGPVLC